MTKLRQILARFRSDENGVALVEMAIVTPFVLLLSAGVFEFSNILNTRLLLEAGVEDAARYMARCGAEPGDPTKPTDPKTIKWAACSSVAKNIAVNGAWTAGTARVAGWTTDQVQIDTTFTSAVDSATPPNELYLSSTNNVYIVKVSTLYSYPDLGFWSYLGFGDLTLSVFHQERVFGW
ncbi:MAG: pilus assembly protein [Mesorhizobium sp.]|uniref:TadE/TadG family type IV pilus assembly protein n=1 Tax=Mesorhizobium sp. TaxID=1871066 RepID=UPI000FE7F5F8|nr:TadE/TadG family type IV pilus assembly protein [Mesorhizobium sp.]RWL84238.1 MAG: pilus assembly protein [Mesorhizobium sp.]RWL88718.1 MAG: pilus assembly protein [Mesorhizobium sp.]RWM03408.1 MAG: pilus assembly protein [Mesorhizobium sp.]